MEKGPEPIPCSDCGQMPGLQQETPEGRLKPVWRMVCSCGQGPMQWSVTPEAAIRLWNRTVGENKLAGR